MVACLWVDDGRSVWGLVFGRCRNLNVNWGGRRSGGVWVSLNPLEHKCWVTLAVGVVCRVCGMGASQQALLTPVYKEREFSDVQNHIMALHI